MKITAFSAQNTFGLKFAELKESDLHDGTIKIHGNNGEGKSSLLNAISLALLGSKAVPERIVRDGQEFAKITATFGEFALELSYKAGDSTATLRVKKGGLIVPQPRAFLDGLLKRHTVNPEFFMGLSTKEQVDTLMKASGVDFDFANYKNKRKRLYDERTAEGRVVKQFEGSVANYRANLPETCPEAIDIVAIGRELTELETKFAKFETLTDRKKSLELKIAQLQEELLETNNSLKSLGDIVGAENRIKELKEQRSASREVDSIIREFASLRKAENDLKASQGRHDELSKRIDLLDNAKASVLSKVKLDVIPSLTVDEDGVYLKGIPFGNLATSEQIRISLAIAVQSNPEIRAIIIKDGNSLDKNNLRMINDFGVANGFQIFMETVGDEGDILIQAGEIVREAVNE